MAKSWSGWYWHLCSASFLAIGGAIASSGDSALAQIVPDDTLGAESSIVSSDLLSGGALRGTNLFESFAEFNIGTGQASYFNNPSAIENIFVRVTGNNPSTLDGMLGASGNANLFLINPNGFIFGPNAALNIGGSLVGTTASSLNFADGTQFSATAPQTTPLLTVSVPSGLQFEGTAGSILNQSVAVDSSGRPVGLQVQPGRTLALVGGDVALAGSNLTAEAGRIELGSVAGSTVVSLTPSGQGWTLGYEGAQTFGDIRLSEGAVVNASGEGGGDIQVQGRRVTLTDGSQISSVTTGLLSGGTVTVNASDAVELIGTTADGQFGSSLNTNTIGTGAAGNLTIQTGQLVVRNGAEVSVSSQELGAAGNLQVAASSILLDNQGTLTATTAAGGGGNIILQSRDLVLRPSSNISTNATGTANGGNITINTGVITASENSDITANAVTGNGGNIQITAQSISGTQFGGNENPTERVPEPSTVGALLLTGLAALSYGKRQNKLSGMKTVKRR